MADKIIAPKHRGRPARSMLAMPRGIQVQTRNGRQYFYYRAGAKGRRAIVSRPSDPVAFLAEITALQKKARKVHRLPYGSSTWGALVEGYRASAKYLLLSERTKSDYDKILGYLGSLDDMPLIQFDAAACEKIRDKALAQKKRAFANYVVQVLKLVLGWGRTHPEFGRYENGAAGLEKFPASGEANRPWTEDECATVIGEATGSLLNAIALGMFGSMRGGDIVKAKWSIYNGTAIEWHQGKTSASVWKPARRMLRDILDASPRIGEMIVCGPDGRPWAEGTLRKSFRDLIVRLESKGRIGKGLTLHGLRSTNATRLADLGADVRAIQAELGHKTAVMSLHYSRRADIKRAATTAVRLLDGEG